MELTQLEGLAKKIFWVLGITTGSKQSMATMYKWTHITAKKLIVNVVQNEVRGGVFTL